MALTDVGWSPRSPKEKDQQWSGVPDLSPPKKKKKKKDQQ